MDTSRSGSVLSTSDARDTTLAPLGRRPSRPDLETARLVVSDAERAALDMAERLRDEAADLLRAADERREETERRVRDEIEAELNVVRRQASDASERAARAEQAASEMASEARRPQEPDKDVIVLTSESLSSVELLQRMSHDARSLVDAAAAEAARLTEEAATQIEADRAAASAARAGAEEELADALRAKDEAEAVLVAAQAEAERMLSDVKGECIRLLEAAREAAEAEFSGLRAEMSAEVAGLRESLGAASAILDRFLAEAPGPDPTRPVVEEDDAGD